MNFILNLSLAKGLFVVSGDPVHEILSPFFPISSLSSVNISNFFTFAYASHKYFVEPVIAFWRPNGVQSTMPLVFVLPITEGRNAHFVSDPVIFFPAYHFICLLTTCQIKSCPLSSVIKKGCEPWTHFHLRSLSMSYLVMITSGRYEYI